jgi:hypothetical protein
LEVLIKSNLPNWCEEILENIRINIGDDLTRVVDKTTDSIGRFILTLLLAS